MTPSAARDGPRRLEAGFPRARLLSAGDARPAFEVDGLRRSDGPLHPFSPLGVFRPLQPLVGSLSIPIHNNSQLW